jgi:hypothetical protein
MTGRHIVLQVPIIAARPRAAIRRRACAVLDHPTKGEALDLPPKTRTWQPVAIGSAAVRRDEARALDFLPNVDSFPRTLPRW